MRSRYRALLAIALVGLIVTACSSSRTDKADTGGVLLSISDFDGLPVQVSVTLATGVGLISVEQLTVQNLPLDPNGLTSDLMNVEIQSYEVIYTRGDTGTRIPTPLVRGLFGVAPIGGTFDVENLPMMSLEQLLEEPLSDLAALGLDPETGGNTILLNFSLRFFGRTLGGDNVSTAPAQFTIEFIP